MKKLPIASDEYQCTWIINGETKSGTLELTGDRGPRGEIFDIPGEWWASNPPSGVPSTTTFSPHTVEFAELRGRLRTNHEVVLINASVDYLFPEQAQIRADMALCGLELAEGSQTFTSAEFQVGGLTELSGRRPIKEMSFPATYTSEMEFRAKWNSEVDQKWCAGTDEEISLKYAAHMKWDRGYDYYVSSSPAIEVTGGARSPEQWMDEYVRPLAQITQFSTTQLQPISWVLLGTRGAPQKSVQVFSQEISQEPYSASSPHHTGVITTLLQLGSTEISLAKLLKDWRSMQEDYDVFFEYLTASLRTDRTWRSRYLAVIPSLESYHAVKHGMGPMPPAEFRKQRKEVLKRLNEAEGVAEQDLQWLKQWVSTLGTYQLRDRLSRLFSDLSPDLQQRITSRIDPLPDSLAGIIQKPKDIWEIMGKVRNNLAHGGPRPSIDQLIRLTNLAHTIAVGLALQDLGLSEKPLLDSIDRGDWRIL